MNLDIFQDIGKSVENIFNDLGSLVEKNFDNPIFWILLVAGLLLFGYFAIHALGDH